MLVTAFFVWNTFSSPQYEFLNLETSKDPASCPEVAIKPKDECYHIPHLNYADAITWHLNRLSALGWEGGYSNDFAPFSFIYQKGNEKIQLIFYPLNSTREGNISTMHYDKAGVGLLIKKINGLE